MKSDRMIKDRNLILDGIKELKVIAECCIPQGKDLRELLYKLQFHLAFVILQGVRPEQKALNLINAAINLARNLNEELNP